MAQASLCLQNNYTITIINRHNFNEWKDTIAWKWHNSVWEINFGVTRIWGLPLPRPTIKYCKLTIRQGQTGRCWKLWTQEVRSDMISWFSWCFRALSFKSTQYYAPRFLILELYMIPKVTYHLIWTRPVHAVYTLGPDKSHFLPPLSIVSSSSLLTILLIIYSVFFSFRQALERMSVTSQANIDLLFPPIWHLKGR